MAVDLLGLGRGEDTWQDTEFCVWPTSNAFYVSVKRIISKSDTESHVDWSFMAVTPAQLRMLADAMERRQMTKNPQP